MEHSKETKATLVEVGKAESVEELLDILSEVVFTDHPDICLRTVKQAIANAMVFVAAKNV